MEGLRTCLDSLNGPERDTIVKFQRFNACHSYNSSLPSHWQALPQTGAESARRTSYQPRDASCDLNRKLTVTNGGTGTVSLLVR